MDSSIVKRNYLYFTLLLLKEKTTEEGDHLSAEDIIAYFKSQYGLEPNRKTIYTVIRDLQAMGFDIRLDKNRSSLGYYLGERPVGKAELQLLVDGIEALDNIKSDDKRDIEEKLCQELGYSFNELDTFLYEKRNEYNETIDEDLEDDWLPPDYQEPPLLDRLNTILRAIAMDKQLTLGDFMPRSPAGPAYLLCDISEEDRKAYDEDPLYHISPYQVFQNSNRELCLLYYISVNGHIYPGFFRLNAYDRINISDKRRPKITDITVFPTDISNYENAREYLAGQQLNEVTLVTNPRTQASVWLGWMLEKGLETYREFDADGEKGYHITYKMNREREIIELILENLPDIRVLEGSRIYNYLMRLRIGLGSLFDPEPLRKMMASKRHDESNGEGGDRE